MTGFQIPSVSLAPDSTVVLLLEFTVYVQTEFTVCPVSCVEDIFQLVPLSLSLAVLVLCVVDSVHPEGSMSPENQSATNLDTFSRTGHLPEFTYHEQRRG